MSSLEPSKQELRAEARALRDALGAAYRAEASEAAAAHLEALRLPSARVALFSRRGSEIDASPLESRLERAGALVSYPRVSGHDLAFAAAFQRALVPAGFGLLEPPADAPSVEAEDFDWILVPGLAFAASTGHRLGYGKGYFDRTLGALLAQPKRPLFVGYAFQVQVVERLPTRPHDVPVDLLITEAGVRAFSAEGRRRLRSDA